MRIFSIIIAVLFLASGALVATPASAAEPLNWEVKVDAPSGVPGVYTLLPGSDILDFAFDSTGMIMYAATGTGLYQSTYYGMFSTEISSRLPSYPAVAESIDIDTIDYVAMAPDDPNVVVVVDASAEATNYVSAAITSDGGATWASMGVIQDGSGNRPTAALGVEISPLVPGNYRYISVYGRDDAGTASGAGAALYYYNYGAGVGAWKDAVADFVNSPGGSTSIDNIVALAFSPNFYNDYTAVALSEQIGGGADNGTLRLHVLSFDTMTWEGSLAVISTTMNNEVFFVNSASLALHPDYDGGNAGTRIAFAGASINGTSGEQGGIWRCRDIDPPYPLFGVLSVGINSVAFDGTNLAAGAYWSNNVYRSADPMTTSPTVLPARSYKKIGIDQVSGSPDTYPDKVQVMFIGETLYGAKRGAASALSRSLDYGNTWNDYALIDSGFMLGPGTITDILVTAAGDPWYLAAYDGGETSIYRMEMFAVQKVLCVDGAYDLMLRGVAANPDVIYAGVEGGHDLYYSADGGLSSWSKYTSPANIADMAVESNDVIYIGQQGSISVYKSINSGSSWSLPIDTRLGAGNSINTLLSVAEDDLLVAGTLSGLSYTTDGGSTWTKTLGIIGGGPVQPAATGLDTGDFIFLADESNNSVWRCEIGPANPVGEFLSMGMPAASAGETNSGIVLQDGVLYVSSNTSSASYLNRTLTPTVAGTHSAPMWGTRYWPEPGGGVFNLSPSALKASTGPADNIVLYAVDSSFSFVYYFDDTLALNGPELISPANGTHFPKDQLVNMLWNRLSKATAYEVALALDADFYALVNINGALGGTGDADPFCEVPGTFDVMSLILDNSYVPPNNTFYWKVRSFLPLVSAWSEVRSFTREPTTAEPETIVRINAPAWAPNSYNFTVPVDIVGVNNLDAASYNVSFNPAVLALYDVTDGDISGTPIPVDAWNEAIPGTVSIVQNLSGTSGVSGSGHLSVLHFTAIGSPVDSTELDIHNGTLSDSNAEEIKAVWIDDYIYIATFIMGDANGDGEVNALDITSVELIIAGLPLP